MKRVYQAARVALGVMALCAITLLQPEARVSELVTDAQDTTTPRMRSVPHRAEYKQPVQYDSQHVSMPVADADQDDYINDLYANMMREDPRRLTYSMSYSYDTGPSPAGAPTEEYDMPTLDGGDGPMSYSYSGGSGGPSPTAFPPTAMPVPEPTALPTVVPSPMPTMAECRNKAMDADIGETDLNCGGNNCPPCALGLRCAVHDDCQTDYCLKAAAGAKYTCQYAPTMVPTPMPSVPPTPMPSPMPTPEPTRQPHVMVTMVIANIDCANDFQESVFDSAMDSVLPGAYVYEPECTDTLADDGTMAVSIVVHVAMALAEITRPGGDGYGTYDNIFALIMGELTTAVSDNSFTTSIQTAAAGRRLDSLKADGSRRRLDMTNAQALSVAVTTFAPTAAPTQGPTPAPSPMPSPAPTMVPAPAPSAQPTVSPAPTTTPVAKKKKKDALSRGDKIGMGVGIPVGVIVLGLAAVFGLKAHNGHFAPKEPAPRNEVQMSPNPAAAAPPIMDAYDHALGQKAPDGKPLVLEC